jgi:DNA-binding MarR family transcriptional regulator
MHKSIRLSDQLCFALHAASRAITGVYRPMLDRFGITYPQFMVLLALWEHDGQTVSELGEALYLDSGTLSPLVKRLEAAGLVKRRRVAADERRVTVHLTAEGMALEADARTTPAEVAKNLAIRPDEAEALRDTLLRLTVSIHKGVE